jgi:hypothetical protein
MTNLYKNSNDEIRMTNQIRMTNVQMTKPREIVGGGGFVGSASADGIPAEGLCLSITIASAEADPTNLVLVIGHLSI